MPVLLAAVSRGVGSACRPRATLLKRLAIFSERPGFEVKCSVCCPQQTRSLKSTTNFGGVSHLSDPENKGQRQAGTNFDALGSWNYRLDLQVNVQQSIKRGSLVPQISLDNVSSVSLLGRRKENEDRILIRALKSDLLLFAVFDGHGGSQAADYAEKHIVDHITFWINRGERNLETVLKRSFIDLNNIFSRHCHKNLAVDEQAMSSGTTATVCLLLDGVLLFVAHVGDSRAILCRDGCAMKLTKEHCPEDKEELARIKANKGFVTWSSIGKPRVNGQLQMTRSIGDFDLKPYGVTAEPDTQRIMIRHSHDAFLVLCTDGVHNVVNSQEMVDIICASRDPQEAAQLSSDQALLFGSEDNCTSVIVPFGAWGKFMPSKGASLHINRSLVGSRFHR